MKIHLYQHPEDGRQAVVDPWLGQQSDRVLHGAEAWLVTPSRLSAHWLRQQHLASGKTWFGIRTLEPWSLRKELAGRLQIDYQPLGRESLELRLRLHSLQHEGALLQSVARNPAPALTALDDLGRAGWGSAITELTEVQFPLSQALPILRNTGGWLPSIDDQLIAKASHGRDQLPDLHLLFWGWDASQAREWKLLLAALATATSVTLLAPAPRLEGRDTEKLWHDFLESTLQTRWEICPERTLKKTSALPRSQLTANLDQQAETALTSLAPHLESNRRIAILLEPNSPLGPILRRQLAEHQIPYFDDIGRPAVPVGSWALRRAWLNYLREECHAEAFLAWLRLFPNPESHPFPKFSDLEKKLRHLFSQSQTPHLPALLADPDATLLLRAFTNIRPFIEPWPGSLTWSQTVERLNAFDAAFGLDPGELEPLIERMNRMLESESVPSHILLEFLWKNFDPGGIERDPDGSHRFAPVILTSRPNARHQAWDVVIFTDANEGVWPSFQRQNPFLNDAMRATLNDQRTAGQGLLLTSLDQSMSERDDLERVLESTTSEVIFLALTHDPTAPQSGLFPNEFFLRFPLNDSSSPQLLPPPRPTLHSAEKTRLQHVRSIRIDRKVAFDQFLWNFGPLPGDLAPWSPSALDRLFSQPATFALRSLFQAEARWGQPWERSEQQAVGTLAHRWLATILQNQFNPKLDALGSALAERIAIDQDHLTGPVSRIPSAAWWRGVLDQAEDYAVSLLEQLESCLVQRETKTEFPLSGAISTALGTLPLKGKIDLILTSPDQTQPALVIDFKTGKAKPTLRSILENRKGCQFAAYGGLLQQTFDRWEVALLKPGDPIHTVLTNDNYPSLQPLFDSIHQIRQTGSFGQQSGSGRFDIYSGENLPFAAVPIDPSILQVKTGLSASQTSIP